MDEIDECIKHRDDEALTLRFLSRKYDQYLEPQKEILTHICRDKKYYGTDSYGVGVVKYGRRKSVDVPGNYAAGNLHIVRINCIPVKLSNI